MSKNTVQLRAAQGFCCLMLLAGLAGCGPSPLDQMVRADQAQDRRMAAQCRAENEVAERAAHPDAKLIARHQRLEKSAAVLDARASRLLRAAIDREGPAAAFHDPAYTKALDDATAAHLDADAVYDAAGKRENAADCWDFLQVVRAVHAQNEGGMRAALDSAAADVAPMPMPTPLVLPQTPALSLPPAPPHGVSPEPVWSPPPVVTPPTGGCIGEVHVDWYAAPPCP